MQCLHMTGSDGCCDNGVCTDGVCVWCEGGWLGLAWCKVREGEGISQEQQIGHSLMNWLSQLAGSQWELRPLSHV